MEATDEDDGANALVFYYLETNTVSSRRKASECIFGMRSLLAQTLFSLGRQTGILRVLGGLDYDNIDTRTHSLVVIAEVQWLCIYVSLTELHVNVCVSRTKGCLL